MGRSVSSLSTRSTLAYRWPSLRTVKNGTSSFQLLDEILLELIADRVESLSGFKPDLDTVAKFLRDNVSLRSSSRPAGPRQRHLVPIRLAGEVAPLRYERELVVSVGEGRRGKARSTPFHQAAFLRQPLESNVTQRHPMRESVKTPQNRQPHRRNPTGAAAALLKMVALASEFALESLPACAAQPPAQVSLRSSPIGLRSTALSAPKVTENNVDQARAPGTAGRRRPGVWPRWPRRHGDLGKSGP